MIRRNKAAIRFMKVCLSRMIMNSGDDDDDDDDDGDDDDNDANNDDSNDNFHFTPSRLPGELDGGERNLNVS